MSKENNKVLVKVLVTGGAGFIGSHVVDSLLDLGYEVVALDDLSGGFTENVNPEATFVEGSINDVDLVNKLFAEHDFDYVFHLAAYAAEGLSHFIKKFNYENNLIGSVNLINASVNHNIKCFVFTSSIAVYGENQLPMKEDLTPQPEDSYGIAKYAVEQELASSLKMFGLPYIIFRPHNVYGEKQNIGDKYRNVIGIFMNQIMAGKKLSVFGDGEQTRAFSYIGDVAPIIAKSIKEPKALNQVFNIGADKPESVNRLAKVVSLAMGGDGEIDHLPARNEVDHAYCDHAKVKEVFNYTADTSLEEGVKKMAEWAKTIGVKSSKEFGHIEIEKNLPPSWKNI
ncbi:UDP-glucose 4-epimerase [archaeon]|nr:UDP-glucose 4-epimerase [archaeon]